MQLVHLELAEANAFVKLVHRHHKPVRGHRFSVGAVKNGVLVGVAIVGRPVSRELDYKRVLEVTRLATDGTKNACSFLYGAAARAGKALGYEMIQTYTLVEEPGTSLYASGWRLSHQTAAKAWTSSKRYAAQGRRRDQPETEKHCWRKALCGVEWSQERTMPAEAGTGWAT